MQIVRPGLDISEIVRIAGAPDNANTNGASGCYVWDAPVWKGIFRGGYVHRMITIYFQDSKVVSWSSENLERSNW